MDWHFTHDVPYKKRKCFRDPNLSGDSFEDNQRQQTFAQDFQGHQEELFAVLCGVDDIGDDILKEYAENIAQEEVNVYPLTKTKRWLDCSQEAIQRLRVNGKLDIKGKEMKVWICTQSEMDVVVDRRRLVLNGLAGDTPKDMVILYVEAISGFLSDDFNIEYFSDAEMAVVTFQTPIDFRCLFEKRSRKKILNKREIKARLLEVTNCVLVEGVALNLIEDLHLYFENKIRSGGGELSNVIIKEDERNVYLYFKDLAVVEEIVSRQHNLCTTELKVVAYYDEICSALGKQDQLSEDPEPFYIPVDIMVMQYILNSCFALKELTSILEQADASFSHGEGSNGNITFKPILDKGAVNYQSLAKKWQQTTETCFRKFYEQYSKNDLPCAKAAWERVKQEVSMPDHVLVGYDCQQAQIFVTGRNQDVQDVCKQLKPFVKNAEDNLSQESRIISDCISLESPDNYNLMQFLNIEDFCAKLNHLHLQFDEGFSSITVTGMSKDCQIIAEEIHNLLMSISIKHLVISDHVLKMFAVPGVVKTLNTQFQKSSIYAIVELKSGQMNDTFTLISIAGHAEKAESCINETFTEELFCVPKAQRDSTRTKEWTILLTDLEKRRGDECQQIILRTFEDQYGSCTEVVIAGFTPAVKDAYGRMQVFCRDNCTVTKFMVMPKYQLEFLEKHELILHDTKLLGKNITVEYEPVSGFQIVGQSSIVNEIETFICEKGFKLCSNLLRINTPGAAKYLRENEDFAKSKVSKDKGCMVFIEIGAAQYPFLQLKCQEDLPGGHTISIYKGDIFKTPVDVVVNTATEKLQILTDGTFGKTLLEIGGSDIQMECNDLVHESGELKPAEVVMTSPGKLPCQNIAHIICGYLKKNSWNTCIDISKMKLVKEGIQNVLMTAGTIGHRSVAIPGLLFERYRYPLDIYTATLIDAVESFCKEEDNADNSLTDILFIDVDDSVLDALANALLCKVGKIPVTDEPDRVVDLLVQNENAFLHPGCPQTQSSATTVTSPSCITTNEGLNISLVIGSIEEENSDVIINTTSANMKLDSGKVSSAIFRKAGPTLQNLVDNIVQGQSIRSGQIVKTDVTGLNLCCHMVYHTSLGSWDNGKHLHKFMKHSLEMAHRDGVSSISFPALGTGMLSYPPAMVSSFMFSEVINFSQSHQKTMLKDIRFVIFSKDQLVISAFQAELAKHLRVLGSSYSGLNEAACSQAAMIGEFCLPTPQRPSVPRKVPPFKSAYQNEVVIVKVFGKLKNNVDDVSKMMKELVDKECSPKRIQSNYVSSLKDEDINVLEKVESDCDVKITLAFTHIQIEGMSSDVFSAATNVNKVMSELEKKHIEESLFTSFAKWLFDDNGQMKAFHKAEVIQIERAFLREEKQVVIKRPAGNLVINFNKNEATNPQGETIRVRRECIFQEPPDPHALKIDIPLNWARMPKGQEVMRVWLHPQSDEYKNVETRFLKTITAFKVFRIERIQNMSLYHTYQVMKKSIESRNDGQVICEKLLFHGTRSDSIDNINHHGFNRSYAGKNATVLGVGTYFALNAWYSASDTYSKPDANGTKYMFQARVLTGSYCKGDASMKEPPLKSPFSKTVRYDSVVDNCFSPSMFVVFYDNQAYPEYLITFSK
uniref:Poly [ADP-ribose] polymerase n=1 Tax=Petromyzon marinus TaxID=7757 RepID=A0AAJ7SMI1_PETMA|nr:protein mono-ADP-ribosyltransferase PARP14-like isoform X1 [Petromyzon marinus]XP_032801825.1 protein mono-ADP-ribosyltransferase PARP14-like isoform X1 [Petromyzon marinus]